MTNSSPPNPSLDALNISNQIVAMVVCYCANERTRKTKQRVKMRALCNCMLDHWRFIVGRVVSCPYIAMSVHFSIPVFRYFEYQYTFHWSTQNLSCSLRSLCYVYVFVCIFMPPINVNLLIWNDEICWALLLNARCILRNTLHLSWNKNLFNLPISK